MSEPRTAAGRALLAWEQSDARPLDEFMLLGEGSFRAAILAIEAEAATPMTLDVERLANAIHSIGKRWQRESGEPEDRHIEANSDQLAADIATEYAMLGLTGSV